MSDPDESGLSAAEKKATTIGCLALIAVLLLLGLGFNALFLNGDDDEPRDPSHDWTCEEIGALTDPTEDQIYWYYGECEGFTDSPT